MSNAPKVSVIIPSYNHKPFIGLLIESIFNQTYKDFELIVLDDGSQDGSPEYLTQLKEKYDFNLVIKDNEGLCKTLNKGIALARGEFFIAIASDDYMPPQRIMEQIIFFETHPEVDVVAGSSTVIDSDNNFCGLKIPSLKGQISFKDMLVVNRIQAPTVMMRMSVFSRFGNYNENHVLEDYYMWLKILKHGGIIFNTNFMWAYYRITNVDLEKKFNWYFKGAEQVFAEYSTDPMIIRQIKSNRFIYSVKMTLLIGKNFYVKYYEHYIKLASWEKILIKLISYLPYQLRDKAMILLKLKT